jgi:ferredoxin
VTRQKTLFPEPPQDGDITHFGDKLPGDFGDYILLDPKEFDPGEELFTLEDEPPPPPQIDHTVLDVQLAIRARDHLQFCTEDRLICGIPVRVCPEGPYYAIHLVKVFEWIGGEWRTAEDRVIVGPLGGGKQE